MIHIFHFYSFINLLSYLFILYILNISNLRQVKRQAYSTNVRLDSGEEEKIFIKQINNNKVKSGNVDNMDNVDNLQF